MEGTKAEFERFGVHAPNPKLKLLDQVREVARLKHYSLRTEETYVQWMGEFQLMARLIYGSGMRLM